MFEHVGRRNFRRYFEQLKQQLRPRGVALLHTIGSTRPPNSTNAWFRRHIFPGGHIPSLSTMSAAIERSGLKIGDLEILRPHYALTLKEWNRRFQIATRTLRRDEGRTVLQDVGVLSGYVADGVRVRRPRRVPAAARADATRRFPPRATICTHDVENAIAAPYETTSALRGQA